MNPLNPRKFWRILALLMIPGWGLSQQFVNSDLNGTVAISSSPLNWQAVPMTDPNCNATQTLYASPDVTSLTGPNSGSGINGNPYSGTTFVTGLEMTQTGSYWHEGIQQTISGFTIGQVYNIRFYQTVVKQQNATDQSGSWMVIRDNTVLSISAPSFSSLVYNSNSLSWAQRNVSFTATSFSHTFKFLPADDDANHAASNQAVRMGIDQISLTTTAVLPWTAELSLSRKDDAVQLDWDMPSADQAASFDIQRSADGFQFEHVGTVNADYIGGYQSFDYYPYDDVSFYRLAQRGNDGSVRFSNVESINMALPLTGHMAGRRVFIRGAQPGPCSVQLIDLQGRVIYRNDQVVGEVETTPVATGVYVLRIVQGEQVFQEKFYIE